MELIKKIEDKYFNFLYAFTISKKLSFINIKKKLQRTCLIELDKLENKSRLNLFYLISFNLKHKELLNKKEKELVKNTNGYPNDIYLRTLYVKCFYEDIYNLDFDKLNNKYIFNKFIEKYGEKIKKIFSIFTILHLGIREDILSMFFKEDEINFIKDFNYIILIEIDEKGKNYYIDSSYKNLIEQILLSKYSEEFLKSLLLISKNYALIFRYLVNYMNYPYNVCFEFHAGINRGFWFSVNEQIYKKKFIKEYKKFIKKKKDIYFDDIKYFNNILNIFINDKMIEIIKEHKEDFNEYISQISICLPTLFHFENSFIYEKRISELFKERLGYLNFDKSRLRLKMFTYWFTGDSNLVPNEIDLNSNLIENKDSKEANKLNYDLKSEINLIKIHDFIKSIDKKNLDISDIYEECKKYCQYNNNNFNLSKLNLLYGMASKNKDNLIYFDKGYEFAKADNNIYMKLLSMIMKAEYFLSRYEFALFKEIINICEKEITKNSNILQNTDINYKLEKAINDKNIKYKKHTKNKLFFFMSTPFFDKEERSLNTESNNSFYLKYNLISKLPKNIKLEFKNIEENFLEELEKYLYNPVRFIYIGSDQYNDEGNLFYTRNFKSYSFDLKSLNETLIKSKNKSDIVILGFLNSEIIAKYFTENKYPHIIAIKNINELNELFKYHPYYYFYFQIFFFIFITEFLLNLSKYYLNITKAFINANDIFNDLFKKIIEYDNGNIKEKNKLKEIINNQILILKNEEKRDDEVFFVEFEDLNNHNFSNSSNNLLNIINDDSKSNFDNYVDNNNNLVVIKNFSLNIEIKEINKSKFEFIKFPGDNLPIEIFEKLKDNRIYGSKKIFQEIINKIKKYRLINLYGAVSCGKTKLCLEICKCFYMNSNFKKGIFYVNIKKLNTIKKFSEIKVINSYKKNLSNKKYKEVNDALLIFDDSEYLIKNHFNHFYD